MGRKPPTYNMSSDDSSGSNINPDDDGNCISCCPVQSGIIGALQLASFSGAVAVALAILYTCFAIPRYTKDNGAYGLFEGHKYSIYFAYFMLWVIIFFEAGFSNILAQEENCNCYKGKDENQQNRVEKYAQHTLHLSYFMWAMFGVMFVLFVTKMKYNNKPDYDTAFGIAFIVVWMIAAICTIALGLMNFMTASYCAQYNDSLSKKANPVLYSSVKNVNRPLSDYEKCTMCTS